MFPRRLFIPSCLLVLTTVVCGAWQDLPLPLAERFGEGVSALKAGRLDTAEQAFRDVLQSGGDRAFVHHNLGIVLQQRDRHADALAEFRAAAKLDPAFGPAHLLAGGSLLALGRAREAVAELERAVRLMPSEPAAHLQLADAYERTGNTAGVVEAYRRLTALAPSNDEYLYRLGKAYLQLAQRSYETIRAINPRSARLPQALGEQYLEQNRPDLAQAAFEEAARLDPALPGVHLSLARIHLDGGRLAEAAAEVARERAISPGSAAARALEGEIQAAGKKR